MARIKIALYGTMNFGPKFILVADIYFTPTPLRSAVNLRFPLMENLVPNVKPFIRGPSSNYNMWLMVCLQLSHDGHDVGIKFVLESDYDPTLENNSLIVKFRISRRYMLVRSQDDTFLRNKGKLSLNALKRSERGIVTRRQELRDELVWPVARSTSKTFQWLPKVV